MHFTYALWSALALGAAALPSEPRDFDAGEIETRNFDAPLEARNVDPDDLEIREANFGHHGNYHHNDHHHHEDHDHHDTSHHKRDTEIDIKGFGGGSRCGWASYRRGNSCYCNNSGYSYSYGHNSCYNQCYGNSYWDYNNHYCGCHQRGYRYDSGRRGCYKY